MQSFIDLRSDTVTTPTPAMRAAMAKAPVGDDFFQDDPTVKQLEEVAAHRLGKEAALFMPSGVMANQVAIMTHTKPGDEIIVNHQCHIVSHEIGAAPRLSGVGYATTTRPDGSVTAEDVARLARPQDPYAPDTGLVCLENALGNGGVVPLATMQAAYAAAKERGIPTHLDGARIFNAALALGVDAKDLANASDSVMFCISKGLCAPIGSLLCGSAAFIQKARVNRKVVGGGMRQAGVLAACGLLSIDLMTRRLGEDHANAETLAALLSAIPGIEVKTERRAINMVFFSTSIPGFDSAAYVAHMRENGIKILGQDGGEYRFVTHKDVTAGDVEKAAAATVAYIDTLV